jgi:5-methylcytosine-specific restriction protein A
MKNQSVITNYGILASISWHSNDWAGEPTKEDVRESGYGYVKTEKRLNESLNFGHDKFPTEEGGYFIGYTPGIKKLRNLENAKNVQIVFFISSDYKNSNRRTIVGFYGFPKFGEDYIRNAKDKIYKNYTNGNIKSHKKDIIYFDKPLVITDEIAQKENFLPKNKKIAKQGFNYLHSDNVYNLLSFSLRLNQDNKKLQNFVKRFPLLNEFTKESNDINELSKIIGITSADSLSNIEELEKKMAKTTPEMKERLSVFIERGTMATKIKKITNYKCLICEAFGHNPHSFKKSNGEYYIEAHHVEPISTMKEGVLSASNIITVCANHHRQLHYGKVTLVEQTSDFFKFKIDGKTIKMELLT